MIIEGYEDCEGDETEGEPKAEETRARVGEGGIAHQAGCIDHGELIDELHWVFQCGVEEKTARPD